jgi:diguanylate cyclase (GGDEF)-like protein
MADFAGVTIMTSLKKTIKYNLEIQKRYFSVANEDILATNLNLLKIVSVLEPVFVAGFILLTPLLFPRWHATYPYWVFLGAALLVTTIVYICAALGRNSYRDVTAMCVLFYVTTLAGSIAVDILPNPSNTSTFFHIIIVVLPAMLVLPFSQIFTVTTGMEALYVVLLWVGKEPVFALTDTYSSIVGFICSCIVMITVSNLRAREGLSKYRYIRQGTIDPLTQCLNRAESEIRIRDYFSARVVGQPPCALLMFDIDDFKNVNDKYGHQSGDLALAKFGSVLSNRFRSADLVGRIGGDEFMVLLTDVRDEASLREVIERILSDISSISGLPDDLKLSSSLGAAMLTGTASYEDMYRSADQAMYDAKRRAAGTYIITVIH